MSSFALYYLPVADRLLLLLQRQLGCHGDSVVFFYYLLLPSASLTLMSCSVTALAMPLVFVRSLFVSETLYCDRLLRLTDDAMLYCYSLCVLFIVYRALDNCRLLSARIESFRSVVIAHLFIYYEIGDGCTFACMYVCVCVLCTVLIDTALLDNVSTYSVLATVFVDHVLLRSFISLSKLSLC